MHLALAPRRRIAASYGPATPAVLAALDEALAARAAAGISTLAYDPEEGAPDLAIAPASLTPEGIVAQLRAVAAAMATRGDPLESLWIVGGPRTLPFGVVPNPVPDSDGPLLTDLVYGLADIDAPMSTWPVGRTPDADPPTPGLLPALLRHVAAAHRAGAAARADVVALSAARWAPVTELVLTSAGAASAAHLLVPPARPAPGDLGLARLIVCNLHGVRGSDAWFGQGPGAADLIPALAPGDLEGADLRGAVVFSQACYGARLSPVAAERTMATALLAAGATAVIVGHGLTYGAPDPPPSDSDLLAQGLIAAMGQQGARPGAALVAAQAAMLRGRLRERGRPDADDLKTLLGFVLYGDPALQ